MDIFFLEVFLCPFLAWFSSLLLFGLAWRMVCCWGGVFGALFCIEVRKEERKEGGSENVVRKNGLLDLEGGKKKGGID